MAAAGSMTQPIAGVSPTAIPQRVSNLDRAVPAPTSVNSSAVKWIRPGDPALASAAPVVPGERVVPAVPVASAAPVVPVERVAPAAPVAPAVPVVQVAQVAPAVLVASVPAMSGAPVAARVAPAAIPMDCPV